jgi:hypothetical protein
MNFEYIFKKSVIALIIIFAVPAIGVLVNFITTKYFKNLYSLIPPYYYGFSIAIIAIIMCYPLYRSWDKIIYIPETKEYVKLISAIYETPVKRHEYKKRLTKLNGSVDLIKIEKNSLIADNLEPGIYVRFFFLMMNDKTAEKIKAELAKTKGKYIFKKNDVLGTESSYFVYFKIK